MKITKNIFLYLSVFSLCIFFIVFKNISGNGLFLNTDNYINQNIIFFQNNFLTRLMILISNICSPEALIVFSIIIGVFFIYKKKMIYLFLSIFTTIGGYVICEILKLIIHKPRPENALIDISSYAFPSGHSTVSIIFFCMLIYLFNGNIKNKSGKIFFIIINIIIFLLIGFTRIYLNVHRFTDVIGGFALGLFCFSLSIILFEKYMK